ncbi:MAG: glutamate-5-semialdehyde dehydrogenase [Clostridia bacterium]|nr:glutamate-5-semialdehyde dehydrogenase [Clostridia bacterium]
MIDCILQTAKDNALTASLLTTQQKNNALRFMADELELQADLILSANKIDVDNATNLSSVMIDRLSLSSARIKGMADGLREVALLPDPVGRVLDESINKAGLDIKKISVPFGVVAVIFESRPNVASDTAGLCLKSGNACILRGGKESFNSVTAIVKALKDGLKKAGLPDGIINTVSDKSRESANRLMTANGYVDLLIPRGGAGLIKSCVQNATVNCIETGTGICHIYVDKSADIDMALDIIENAKTSRPSVCNAEEVLLIHTDIKKDFLPKLYDRLVSKRIATGKTPVELRLHDNVYGIIDGKKAGDNDFDTEFLDYVLAVKAVDDVVEAVNHIAKHSTHHSEAVIATDNFVAETFTKSVDSAAVYVNASTRFTDGGEFGLGCEIGISTQKLHARGPMGLNELNTYKYIVKGNGQIR